MNSEVRVDRVVSRLPDGLEHVCTLVLNGAGLYLIHTGDVDDLPGYRPNQTDRSRLETILDRERLMEQTPLEDLADDERSAYVVPTSIRELSVETENLPPGIAVPVIQFETNINTYRLLFPYTPMEQVRSLGNHLRNAAGD